MQEYLKKVIASYKNTRKELDERKQMLIDETNDLCANLVPLWKEYQLESFCQVYDGFKFELTGEYLSITPTKEELQLTLGHLRLFQLSVSKHIQFLLDEIKEFLK